MTLEVLTAVKKAIEQSPQRNFSENVDLAINLKKIECRCRDDF
jgi:ribosomal protein L1